MTTKVGSDASARNTPDLGGDILDDDHHGCRQDQHPPKTISELRASLAVSCNPAGIIVSRASDKPRAKQLENARARLGSSP